MTSRCQFTPPEMAMTTPGLPRACSNAMSHPPCFPA
jgi:hypothetical protein